MSVIYQTAEDGLADTIKPRLEAAGADCSRVLVIDESKRGLTLCDDRLEQAVHRTGARLKEDPAVRIVAQDKNSLAPEGKSIAFQLDGEQSFQRKDLCELTVDDVLGGGGKLQTKATQMEEELWQMLTETVPAETVLRRAKKLGVSERTLMTAKKNLGVLSERRGGQWYWKLPAQDCKAVED